MCVCSRVCNHSLYSVVVFSSNVSFLKMCIIAYPHYNCNISAVQFFVIQLLLVVCVCVYVCTVAMINDFIFVN